MWQLLTEPARMAVYHADAEARRLGSSFLSTEHLLLGILDEDQQRGGARLLESFGLKGDQVRSEVERLLSKVETQPCDKLSLTPEGKQSIDFAYAESVDLKHPTLGPEHLLLGLIREPDGLAGRVLSEMGVEIEQARKHVRAMHRLLEAASTDPKTNGGSALALLLKKMRAFLFDGDRKR